MIIKPIVFSGAQPSGMLTLGNYIGAISQWVRMQNEYQCIFCIADLHSITSMRYVSSQLYKVSLDTLAMYLACGVNPDNNIIFLQSHVPEHTQLHWLLNSCVNFGELNRMIQFKEKSIQYKSRVNVGVFNYPVLMASDILLYNTNLVPVGDDQKQHLELACKIAKRFNYVYGTIFTIPEIFVVGYGSRVMSLLDPGKKMSKSDINVNNVIYLLDDINVVFKKINRAVTDSDYPPVIRYDIVNKPGISNLLVVLSGINNKSIVFLEKIFREKTYFQLKSEVIKVVSALLTKIQYRYDIERSDEYKLQCILRFGARKARHIARLTLRKVYKVMGFVCDNTVL